MSRPADDTNSRGVARVVMMNPSAGGTPAPEASPLPD